MLTALWPFYAVTLYVPLMACVVHVCESRSSQSLDRATVPVKLLLTVLAPLTLVVMLFIALVIYPRTTDTVHDTPTR